jgi:hypothetical protein
MRNDEGKMFGRIGKGTSGTKKMLKLSLYIFKY